MGEESKAGQARLNAHQSIVPHNIETTRTLDAHEKEAADCSSTLEVTVGHMSKQSEYTPRVEAASNYSINQHRQNLVPANDEMHLMRTIPT